MPNNKFPEHDYLSKEFYGHFWGNFKIFFINSLKQSKIDGHLPISQRQVIIKLLLKKKKNWWQSKLLNGDTKILPESLVEKLKPALPELISSNQRAYVKYHKELFQVPPS